MTADVTYTVQWKRIYRPTPSTPTVEIPDDDALGLNTDDWFYLAMQEATNSHEYERKADGVHETQTAKRENRDWSKEFEQ